MLLLPIKSTLVDRKIAVLGFSAASLLAHSGTGTEGPLGVIFNLRTRAELDLNNRKC
jgi:hypothetical protein